MADTLHDHLSPAGRVIFAVWLRTNGKPRAGQRYVVERCMTALTRSDRAHLERVGALPRAPAEPPAEFAGDPRFAAWEAGRG